MKKEKNSVRWHTTWASFTGREFEDTPEPHAVRHRGQSFHGQCNVCLMGWVAGENGPVPNQVCVGLAKSPLRHSQRTNDKLPAFNRASARPDIEVGRRRAYATTLREGLALSPSRSIHQQPSAIRYPLFARAQNVIHLFKCHAM
ncbi:hypothetical protein HAX54_001022 [Datura stramonium]|uniref:Uncharacterized protein n=1 Tax=Datura stramonium TaxID=4076 RepID=A0ABS8WSJ4_DATST|nr:hypothetical protein [Datura stramonium]